MDGHFPGCGGLQLRKKIEQKIESEVLDQQTKRQGPDSGSNGRPKSQAQPMLWGQHRARNQNSVIRDDEDDIIDGGQEPNKMRVPTLLCKLLKSGNQI